MFSSDNKWCIENYGLSVQWLTLIIYICILCFLILHVDLLRVLGSAVFLFPDKDTNLVCLSLVFSIFSLRLSVCVLLTVWFVFFFSCHWFVGCYDSDQVTITMKDSYIYFLFFFLYKPATFMHTDTRTQTDSVQFSIFSYFMITEEKQRFSKDVVLLCSMLAKFTPRQCFRFYWKKSEKE